LICNQAADRRTAAERTFDKRQVFEIKNSALFLAIAVSDIKDIKRRQTLISPPAGDPDMTSNGFDFIQTAPRQSLEFLNFNQSFSFKGDSENAERR